MRIDKAVMTLKNYTESKERSPSSAVREAAEDYVRACELINTDLARLEELLNKNLRSEAMQYANIEPRIEDQVAQLNFPGRVDFEMMAAFQDLPVGSPLKMEVIENLQSAYAEYQSLEHQYRNLRKLVLERAPVVERVNALREIAMLDRINATLIEDLAILEKQLQLDLLKTIRESAQTGDIQEMFEAKEEFKQNWINPPAPGVIEEIETITSKKQEEYSSKELTDLANRGMSYMRAKDYQNAKKCYESWAAVAGRVGVKQGDSYWARIEPLYLWLQKYENDSKVKEFADMQLFALRKALLEVVLDAKCAQRIAEFERMYAEVENSGAKVPKDLQGLFDSTISRMVDYRKKHELFLLAGLFAGGIILLLAFLIWMVARSR